MITFEQLEAMRVALKKKYTLLTIIGIIVLIVAAIVILSMELPFTFGFSLIMVVGVVYLIIALALTSKQAKEFSLSFKSYFVKSSLEKIFTNLKYLPDSGISRETIASTNMMRMGDRYSSNDLVIGNYKNIGFTQSDVHIEEEHETRDSDGHTRRYYVTIFKGRWMIFDFNKVFKADVQVAQKGFGNNKVGSWFSGEQKFQKVEMESQEFNKAFNVYAQQPLDAFYILTPKVMEKIKNLDERNDGKLLLCFINNKLHVGIYNYEDSFEHKSVFSKIDEEKTRNDISTDIQKITMFVDELELDNDLFKNSNI